MWTDRCCTLVENCHNERRGTAQTKRSVWRFDGWSGPSAITYWVALCSDHAPLQWLHCMKETNAQKTILLYSPLTSKWFIGRGRRWWWLSFYLARGGGWSSAGWLPGLSRGVGFQAQLQRESEHTAHGRPS